MPTVSSTDVQELEGIEKLQASDDVQEMSLVDIYENVYTNEDIIIVIDAIDEARIRKGLSSIKAKRNAKLKESNLPTEDLTLEFVKHEDAELAKQNRVRLQIFMKAKPTVKIHKLEVADGEL